MPRKIILIRHGETEYNRKGRWQGWTDEPLNEAGIEQSEKVARRLQGEVIDALYSSDLSRAFQTAELIAKRLGMSTIKTNELRERNMGVLEGSKQEKLSRKEKRMFEKFLDPKNDTYKEHGGETIQEVKARIKSFFKKLKTKHQDTIVAIVTHGGTKYYMLKLLMQELPKELRFGNTAITVLKKDSSGKYHITILGDTGHLNP